ncbi:MAG: serine/threonine-protein kinase [Gemmatimonadota bacterium]
MSIPEFASLQAALAGRFLLEREIGRGGMGVVLLARDTALERPVAIKLLPAILASDATLRARFLLEARTAARLGHPHIVPIHAVEEHGDQVCFIMAFVPGQTLAERVREQGPMAAGEVARIVREIAWALAYAHQQGVVHRDVKPENILLERGSGRALITDFGIAQVAASAGHTPAGGIRGTLRYMSPEQAEGEPVDGRSDLYALGLTARFALTGRVPFEGEEPAALLVLKASQVVPPLAAMGSDIPAALATILDRCVATAPDDRFATADALADALGEIHGIVSSSPVLQRLAQEVAAIGVDIGGFASLAVVAVVVQSLTRDFLGFGLFYTLGLCTLMVGLIALRSMSAIRLLREASAEGWEVGDLEAAARRGRPTTGTGGPAYIRRRIAIWAGIMVGLTLFWLGPRAWTQAGDANVFTWIVELFSLGAPVAAGRWLAGSLERRPDGKLGPFTTFFLRFKAGVLLRLAGLGRKGRGRASLPAEQLTEVALAGQARQLMQALPKAERGRIEGAGSLLDRLVADASELRGKLEEIAGAEAAIGPIQGEARKSAQAEMQLARQETLARLATTMQALEQLRLDLLRAQAMAAGGEGLTEDLAVLDRLSRRVDDAK